MVEYLCEHRHNDGNIRQKEKKTVQLSIHINNTAHKFIVTVDGKNMKPAETVKDGERIIQYEDLTDKAHRVSVKEKCLLNRKIWFLRLFNPMNFFGRVFFKEPFVSQDDSTVLEFTVQPTGEKTDVYIDYHVEMLDSYSYKSGFSVKADKNVSDVKEASNPAYSKRLLFETYIPPVIVISVLFAILIRCNFASAPAAIFAGLYTLAFFIKLLFRR